MNTPTTIPLTDLGAEQLEYLRQARMTKECSARMVYVPQIGFAGRVTPLVFGGFLAALTATLLAAAWIDDTSGFGSPAFRSAVTGATFTVTIALILVATRNILEPWLGHFALVDRRQLWIVSGGRARTIALSAIRDARCVHDANAGRYLRSSLFLETDSGEIRLEVAELRLAEIVVRAIALWRETPHPAPLPAGDQASRPRLPRRLTPAGIALIIGTAATCALPAYFNSADEAVEFSFAKRFGDVSALRSYFHWNPDGRYVEEATGLLDDALWHRAVYAVERDGSAEGLRDYLGEPLAVDHRDDAESELDRLYDESLDRIRAAATSTTATGELAMLEALVGHARTNGPEIRIAFTGAFSSPSVESPDSYDLPLLPFDAAFEATRVRDRQDVIARVLRESIEELAGPGLLDFRMIDEGESPQIEIDYTVTMPGDLYVVAEDVAGRSRERGLIHACHVEWHVRVLDRFDFTMQSRPAENIPVRMSNRDPDWAPYAIMMYSAFRDMGAGLVARLGLIPPPAPTSITFAEATRD